VVTSAETARFGRLEGDIAIVTGSICGISEGVQMWVARRGHLRGRDRLTDDDAAFVGGERTSVAHDDTSPDFRR